MSGQSLAGQGGFFGGSDKKGGRVPEGREGTTLGICCLASFHTPVGVREQQPCPLHTSCQGQGGTDGRTGS